MADAAAPETRTSIDSMIELLRSKGKMELSQISETLDVDQNIIENWAKVLEKGSLVKISYEVGKMFVTPSGFTQEQETSAKTEMQTKTSAIESAASAEMLSLDTLSDTLKGIRASVSAAEKLESDQMPQMRKAIAQIDSIYSSVDQRTRAIDQMAKRANELYDSINKRATDLASRISQIEAVSTGKGVDEAKRGLAQIMSDASEIDKQIALMGKSAGDSINRLRQEMEEQMKQLRQQMDSNRREIDAKMKEYSSMLSESERDLRGRVKAAGSIAQESSEFEREKEKIKRRISDIMVEFNDAYAKTRDEINRSKVELDATSKSLLDQIEFIRKSFGDAASIDDSITRAKSELTSIESEIAAQKQEVSGILSQVRNVQSTGELDKKKAAIDGMKGRADKAVSNVGNIRKRIKKASDEVEEIGKKEEQDQKEA